MTRLNPDERERIIDFIKMRRLQRLKSADAARANRMFYAAERLEVAGMQCFILAEAIENGEHLK